jgi:hypothetical protein
MDSDVKMCFDPDKSFVPLDPYTFYHGIFLIIGAATTGSCLLEKDLFDLVRGLKVVDMKGSAESIAPYLERAVQKREEHRGPAQKTLRGMFT